MERTNEKACLECGESFRGRSDKKFCNDQCRNTYNNRCSRDSNGFVREVNHILRKNRKILESLVPGSPVQISRRRLSEKGFNFEFNTGTRLIGEGRMLYFCYEFGYINMHDDLLELLNKTTAESEYSKLHVIIKSPGL